MIGRCRTKNSFALLLASALLAGIVQAEIRPNVVVFLVDDMGLMDTSVPFVVDKEGNPVPQPLNARYRTPNMEKLAERGVRFAHFYANSVCSPSRVSLLKGQYSARHKTTDFIHPQKKNVGPKDWNWDGITTVDNTLQGLMKAAGYKTVIIGKGHLGSKVSPGEDPLKIGFTDKVAASHFGAPGSYYDDKCFGIKTLRAVPDLEKYHGKDIFLTEALSLEATREIDEAVKERKPFFLYMSHYAVHTPFEADPRFVDNYKGSKNKNWRAFATLIEGMDKSLGDLVNHLERIGEAENTLIIFLGDNGSYAPLGRENDVGSSAPYRGKKGSRYEGGTRAPFIVSWAKPNPKSGLQNKFPVTPGIVHKKFATICDVMPTVLKVTNIEEPKGYKMDGEEITALLRDHDSEHRQQFLMHYPHFSRGKNYTTFRDHDWKIIKNYGLQNDKMSELYNLADDPYELMNRARENPEQLEKMKLAMQAQLDDCEAQYFEGSPTLHR